MDGPTAGVFVFACLASAASVGAVAHARLPNGLLTEQTAVVIRRGVWIIAIMAGIMLSSLTIYLKTHFDSASRDVRAFSYQIVDLDRTLRRIGPDAEPARALLFRFAARTMKDVWPATDPRLGPDDTHAAKLFADLEAAVTKLDGATPLQRDLAVTARRLLPEVGRGRWTMDVQSGRAVSPWMLSLLVMWLMLTFGSLGLSSHRSRLALGILFVCAAALSSAVFLAVEYADPYQGIIIVSSEPLRNALFTISD